MKLMFFFILVIFSGLALSASDEELFLLLNKDQKFVKIQSEIADLNNNLNIINNELAPLKIELSKALIELSKIRSSKLINDHIYIQAENKYLAISTVLFQLQKTLEENESDILTRSNDLKDLNIEIGELVNQIEDYQSKLDRVVQRETKLNYQYKAQRDNCENNLECSKEDVEYMQKIWQQEIYSMKSIEAQIASLSAVVDDKNLTRKVLNDEISAREYYLTKIQKEILDKSDSLSFLVSELAFLKAQIKEQQDQEITLINKFNDSKNKIAILSNQKIEHEEKIGILSEERTKMYELFKAEYNKVIELALINAKQKSNELIKQNITLASTKAAAILFVDKLKKNSTLTCGDSINEKIELLKRQLLSNSVLIFNPDDLTKIEKLGEVTIDESEFTNTSELLVEVYHMVYQESFKKFAAEYLNEKGSILYAKLIDLNLSKKQMDCSILSKNI